jgi:hypothetical protein
MNEAQSSSRAIKSEEPPKSGSHPRARACTDLLHAPQVLGNGGRPGARLGGFAPRCRCVLKQLLAHGPGLVPLLMRWRRPMKGHETVYGAA